MARKFSAPIKYQQISIEFTVVTDDYYQLTCQFGHVLKSKIKFQLKICLLLNLAPDL